MNARQYAYWITLLALAKEAKDYELADMARGFLHQVQKIGDERFLEMHRTKVYTWHPMLSPGGKVESHVP